MAVNWQEKSFQHQKPRSKLEWHTVNDECVKTISYSLSLVCSVSSVFSVQFNQFSKKTQNLTFIDIKYVLYHNNHFFLYKKGLFCNKYQEIILNFSNLRLKNVIFAKRGLHILGKDYLF